RFFHCILHIRVSGAPRRQRSEQQAGEERKTQSKRQNRPIKFGQRLPDKRRSKVASRVAQSCSGCSTAEGQQQTFRKCLPQNARSARSQSDTQAHFLLSSGGA